MPTSTKAKALTWALNSESIRAWGSRSSRLTQFPCADTSGRQVLIGVYNDPKHGDYIFPIAVEVILQTYATNGAGNSLFPSTA